MYTEEKCGLTAQTLRKIVEEAVELFNAREKYLIVNDLSERCVCARFAMYMMWVMEQPWVLERTGYKSYDVDVEYNRSADGCERSVKRIDDAPITVDLIVHKRGYDPKTGFDNLIAIEMKKSGDRRGSGGDEERLKKLVNSRYGFCYQGGFLLVIDRRQACLTIRESFFPWDA